MKKIKTYKGFQKIYEFSEFHYNRLSGETSYPQPNVDDPVLSINAFDKQQDAIRSGVARINDILKNLISSSSFGALRSKLLLDDQNLQKLKILRV